LWQVAKLQITEKGVQVVTTTGQTVCPEKPDFDKVVSEIYFGTSKHPKAKTQILSRLFFIHICRFCPHTHLAPAATLACYLCDSF
jgi:hypothetical protein